MNVKQRLKSTKQRIGAFIDTFFLKPASGKPLAALRIGIATVLLLQALSLSGSFLELYGPKGIIQRSVYVPPELANEKFLGPPSVKWVIDAFAMVNIQLEDEATTKAVFLIYIAALCGMLVGWRSRTMAFFAWGMHFFLNGSGDATIYGVDQFAHIFLFYCILMPTGGAWSLDQKAGRVTGEPTAGNRVALRVLQLHLCIVYFATGIHKAMGADWWDGTSIWRALNLREMALFDFTWIAYVPGLAVLLGLGTLAVEVGYPFLVWAKKTRKWMALATIGLHVGIGSMMGLISFSALMIVFTTSAFLFSGEPATEPVAATEPELEPDARLGLQGA